MTFTLARIAEQIHGEAVGDSSVQITGFSTAEAARSGDIVFAENETYFASAEQSAASAILVSGPFTSAKKTSRSRFECARRGRQTIAAVFSSGRSSSRNSPQRHR